MARKKRSLDYWYRWEKKRKTRKFLRQLPPEDDVTVYGKVSHKLPR